MDLTYLNVFLYNELESHKAGRQSEWDTGHDDQRKFPAVNERYNRTDDKSRKRLGNGPHGHTNKTVDFQRVLSQRRSQCAATVTIFIKVSNVRSHVCPEHECSKTLHQSCGTLLNERILEDSGNGRKNSDHKKVQGMMICRVAHLVTNRLRAWVTLVVLTLAIIIESQTK